MAKAAKNKVTPKKDILGEKLVQEKFSATELDDILTRIKKARFYLLIKQPFFGIVTVKMQLQLDDTIRTAATNGQWLKMNPSFINKLTDKQIVFILCHEVMHLAYDHFTRRENRIFFLFNLACDYAINQMGVREKLIDEDFLKDYCYDKKYDNMSAEAIYELLKNEFDNEIEEIKKKIENGELSPGDAVNLPGCGITIDVHVDIGENSDNSSNPELGKGETGSDLDKMSDSEKTQVQNEVRSSIIQAAKTAESRQAGSCPADILRMVNEWTNPRISWKKLIRVTLQNLCKSDTSFSRVGRRTYSGDSGFIYPGQIPEEVFRANISIDLSGSIGPDECKEFLTEVKGALDTYNQYCVNIWTFDTQCYGYYTITSDNPEEFLTFVTEGCKGGGGTDISSNWRYMNNNPELLQDVELFIIFTDTYGRMPDESDSDMVETVWITKGADINFKPPFGQVARYEDV